MPIIIKSKKEGFRRCGIAHSKRMMEYPDGFFTDEQLAALKADPMLEVTGFEYPEEQSDQGDGVENTPMPAAEGENQTIKVTALDGTVHQIQGAPEDEADFLAWLEGLTVSDLKYICRDIGFDFPAKAKKADLIELITFNTAFPPAEAKDTEA